MTENFLTGALSLYTYKLVVLTSQSTIYVDKFPKKGLTVMYFFFTVGTVFWCQSVPYPHESSAFETEHFYTYRTLKWIQSFSYRNKFPISHYNAVTRMDDIECRNQDPRKDYILSADSPSTPVVNRSGEHYWSLRRHGTVWRISQSLHQTAIQILHL